MSPSLNPSLHTLPIECVCRILDHLRPLDLVVSMRSVCSRLDAITNTYQPYAVSIVIEGEGKTIPRGNLTLHWAAFKHETPFRLRSISKHECIRKQGVRTLHSRKSTSSATDDA